MLLWPALEQDLSVSPVGRYCLIKDHKVICHENEKSKLIAKIYIYIEILIRLLCAHAAAVQRWAALTAGNSPAQAKCP